MDIESVKRVFDSAASVRDLLQNMQDEEWDRSQIKPRSALAQEARGRALHIREAIREINKKLVEALPKHNEVSIADGAYLLVAAHGRSGTVGDLLEWQERYPEDKQDEVCSKFWDEYQKRYPKVPEGKG